MSNEFINYFKANSKTILTIIAIVVAAIVLFKLLPYFAPFVVALVFASLIEPLIRFLMAKIHLKRKLAASISLVFAIVVIGFLVYILVDNLISQIMSLLSSLPALANEFIDNINPLIKRLNETLLWIPDEISINLYNILSEVTSSLSTLLQSLVKSVYAIAASLPQLLVFLLVTIISTFFISSDRDKIILFIMSQLPIKWQNSMGKFKKDMFLGVFKLIKAYIILLFITLIELYIGLSIIGIKYSLVLSIFISIIDLLPILGSGTVLVPWSIYSFITGDIRLGISLLVLYIVILVVRQMLEPKVIGQQIGVYPLVTLMSMYVGLQIAGVAGLLLGPILLVIVKSTLPGVFIHGFKKPNTDKE